MSVSDPDLLTAELVASALLGRPIAVSRVAAAGRNSRIYRVRTDEHEFALKQYPARQSDPRDRLGVEVGSLELMRQYGIKSVPQVIGVDRQRGYVLMTWIAGTAITAVGDADVDAACAFLKDLHGLRSREAAKLQPPASEACLAGNEIEHQIWARLETLRSLRDEPELSDFVETAIVRTARQTIRSAREHARTGNLDFAAELPQEYRSLIPADFGFHNSLRCSDGSLAFLDFEYFGWDDPVKLTADILLHPGHPLPPRQLERFRQGALRLYGEDRMFQVRLSTYFPLFGLRWVLILLNEFVPERWQRRVLAGVQESWGEAKSRQLAHARMYLASLSEIAVI